MTQRIKSAWSTVGIAHGRAFLLLLIGVALGACRKETLMWDLVNVGASNFMGFGGRPGGYRLSSGEFGGKGIQGYWWSSTNSGSGRGWNRQLHNVSPDFFRNSKFLTFGMSVRCIKE